MARLWRSAIAWRNNDTFSVVHRQRWGEGWLERNIRALWGLVDEPANRKVASSYEQRLTVFDEKAFIKLKN